MSAPAGFRGFDPPPGTRDGSTREIEPPSYFNRDDRASDTMSFRELIRHIASLEALGLDVTKLRAELHRKIAYPAVALVMTLLGIPFAFVVARHGALRGRDQRGRRAPAGRHRRAATGPPDPVGARSRARPEGQPEKRSATTLTVTR